MSEHKATIRWQNNGPDFLKGKYSREHTWTFDGGIKTGCVGFALGSAGSLFQSGLRRSGGAFVAAVSSCHMLTFIYLAGRQRDAGGQL